MSSAFLGKVIDNYRILENLGIGGMGIVFKAIHIKLEKLFALKMIAPSLVMNESFIKRFQTEARALAKFEDPNIVKVYDLRSADDQWFIVMEYVDGIHLLDKIKKEGAMDWQEALPILKQVLTAIGHAHDTGIVHRDIKPNNIMITKDGTAKITDFGLAKDQSSLTHTMTVSSGGTLYYMSPEHVKGLSFTDKRSDIYSIGMTFYEIIAGCVPFKKMNSDFEIREAIMRKEFVKPSSFNPAIPADLESIIMKSIAKNPNARYQTTQEMLEAIIRFETNYTTKKPVNKTSKESSHKRLQIQSRITHVANYLSNILKKYLPKKYRLGVVSFILLTMLILYAAFFTSTNKSTEKILTSGLTIFSDPPEALVYLNGDSLGQTPLQDLNLPSAHYSMSVVKKNYQTIDTTIFLSSGNHHQMDFLLQKTVITPPPVASEKSPPPKKVKPRSSFASLTIRSNPSQATIWLNGQIKGQTPLHLSNIKPGEYQLEVGKEGYGTYKQKISLKARENMIIRPKLKLMTGSLIVVKEPHTARIKLNGKYIADLDYPIDQIPIGKYQLEITASGYTTFNKDITITPDKVDTIYATLVRLEGELSILVRPWGSIYINEQLHKSSADTRYKIILPVGQFEIKAIHPTLGTWKRSVKIQPEKVVDLTVDFNRKIKMQVEAVDQAGNPVYAEIFLDNQNTGKSTPEKIDVRPGVHRLMVRKDGYFTPNGEREIMVDEHLRDTQTFILNEIK
jgi:serine/threonine protein kinase